MEQTERQSAPFIVELLQYMSLAQAAKHDNSTENRSSESEQLSDDTNLLPLLLAASYRTKDDNLNVPTLNPDYLRHELGVRRLNEIHSWLWMVGRPMPPRALHH